MSVYGTLINDYDKINLLENQLLEYERFFNNLNLNESVILEGVDIKTIIGKLKELWERFIKWVNEKIRMIKSKFITKAPKIPGLKNIKFELDIKVINSDSLNKFIESRNNLSKFINGPLSSYIDKLDAYANNLLNEIDIDAEIPLFKDDVNLFTNFDIEINHLKGNYDQLYDQIDNDITKKYNPIIKDSSHFINDINIFINSHLKLLIKVLTDYTEITKIMNSSNSAKILSKFSSCIVLVKDIIINLQTKINKIVSANDIMDNIVIKDFHKLNNLAKGYKNGENEEEEK